MIAQYLKSIRKMILIITLYVLCYVIHAQSLGNATGLNYHISYLNNKKNPLRKEMLIGVLSEYPLSFETVRDSTGKVIRKEGVSSLIFWWVADRFNFDAELLEVTIVYPFDQNTSLPVDYKDLMSGRINMVLGFFVMTPKRNRLIDFTQPFFFEPLTLILPDPTLNSDVWSVWKAFETQVWIGIFLSMFTLGLLFWVFQLFHSHYYEDRGSTFAAFDNGFQYIVEVLFNQGSYCYSNFPSVRLLAGVWCLAAYVLVNTYNSTLTAYLMVNQRPQPIIRSIFDLGNNSNVKILVKKGSGTDFLFSTTEKGFYKQLGDMLQSNPVSRCATDKECLNLVRTGSYVYANPEFAAFDAMANEYKSTKKCEFTVIREYSLAISMAFFTAKSSPVLEPVNRGILSMNAFGLINDWITHHRPTLSQCHNTDFAKLKLSRDSKNSKKIRLSLKHTMGAFVVLAIGLSISAFVLICEILISRCVFLPAKKSDSKIG